MLVLAGQVDAVSRGAMRASTVTYVIALGLGLFETVPADGPDA